MQSHSKSACSFFIVLYSFLLLCFFLILLNLLDLKYIFYILYSSVIYASSIAEIPQGVNNWFTVLYFLNRSSYLA